MWKNYSFPFYKTFQTIPIEFRVLQIIHWTHRHTKVSTSAFFGFAWISVFLHIFNVTARVKNIKSTIYSSLRFIVVRIWREHTKQKAISLITSHFHATRSRIKKQAFRHNTSCVFIYFWRKKATHAYANSGIKGQMNIDANSPEWHTIVFIALVHSLMHAIIQSTLFPPGG